LTKEFISGILVKSLVIRDLKNFKKRPSEGRSKTVSTKKLKKFLTNDESYDILNRLLKKQDGLKEKIKKVLDKPKKVWYIR
jgi:hypothetical protein